MKMEKSRQKIIVGVVVAILVFALIIIIIFTSRGKLIDSTQGINSSSETYFNETSCKLTKIINASDYYPDGEYKSILYCIGENNYGGYHFMDSGGNIITIYYSDEISEWVIN